MSIGWGLARLQNVSSVLSYNIDKPCHAYLDQVYADDKIDCMRRMSSDVLNFLEKYLENHNK